MQTSALNYEGEAFLSSQKEGRDANRRILAKRAYSLYSESVEKIPSPFQHLSGKEEKRLQDVLQDIKNNGDVSIRETESTLEITRRDGEKERTYGFTKIGDSVPLANGTKCRFSEMVEARNRFPNDNIITAISKLREEQKRAISSAG